MEHGLHGARDCDAEIQEEVTGRPLPRAPLAPRGGGGRGGSFSLHPFGPQLYCLDTDPAAVTCTLWCVFSAFVSHLKPLFLEKREPPWMYLTPGVGGRCPGPAVLQPLFGR